MRSAFADDDLNGITVEGIRPDESVVPGNKQISSALGLDLPVQDVPRSVTVLSDTQLNDANITKSEDLVRLIPDAYTYHINGSPGTPLIRGQYADTLVNGFRLGLTSNGVGTPIDFNAAEKIDVFRGPATAIYGASIYNGGFINLVTKQPFFDGYHGSTSFTAGQYDQYRWTADFGGPLIKDKLAFRVSYYGEESGSYYQNDYLQNQAVYAIVSWHPTDSYSVDFINDFYESHYQYNNGINRPTRDLINNGRYITGTQQFVNFTGTPVTAANFNQVLVPSTTPGFGGVVVPTGTVNIDRSRNLINPSDSSYAKTDLAQVIQRLLVQPGFEIVNSSTFYYLYRWQFAALRYSAIVKPTYAVEDRLEFKFDFDQPWPRFDTGNGGGIHHQVNAGFDFRYQNVYAATDFNHEFSNLYDLTLSPNLINVPLSVVTSNAPGSNRSYLVPGTHFYASTGGTYNNVQLNTGNGETNDSTSYDYAVYFEDRIQIGKPLALFFGAREDVLSLHFVDPVHPVGFDPVSASATYGMYNLNTSITLKPVSALTLYFTYDRTQTTDSAQAGGVRVEANNKIVAADYHNENSLIEGGAKATLFNNKLYLAGSLFMQTRTVPQQGLPAVKEDISGVEADLNFQPNKNFYLTMSYSYLLAIYHDQSLFQS
ncbi:MAG: TonB-dependent receptor plug domain-containing protein, partial [Verrucomicrobia bacterium]|nr:TonB-dependent receptor plug domain-containing protein [Verrucomicrobiota bacterium]